MADRARGAGNRPGGAASTAFTVLSTMAVSRSVSNPYVKWGFAAVVITLDVIKWWIENKKTQQNVNEETRQNVNIETRQNVNKQIPQCRLIEGVAEKGGIVYRQEVVRYSQEPYTVRYSHPTDMITGIACVPLSAEIQSPEADVVDGGINCSYVTIRLTPVERGKWACKIAICTKPSAARPAIEQAPQQAIQKAVKQDDELSVKEDIQQNIKQAVQEAVQEVVKQAVEEAVQAVQQSVNQVIQEAVQQTAQQAVQGSVQQPAQQVIQQADQQDTQQAVKQRRRRRRRRTQNQVSCNST